MYRNELWVFSFYVFLCECRQWRQWRFRGPWQSWRWGRIRRADVRWVPALLRASSPRREVDESSQVYRTARSVLRVCVCVLSVCLCSQRCRPWRNGAEDLWYLALPVGHRSGHGGRTHRVAQPADQTVPRHVHRAVQRALPHHTQDRAGTHTHTSLFLKEETSFHTQLAWILLLCVSLGAPCSTTR